MKFSAKRNLSLVLLSILLLGWTMGQPEPEDTLGDDEE